MDSRAAAAPPAALPHYPLALLELPDLDRPPAIMEMWELEAVAAALPAKKQRLRETFDRLVVCSPTPLPFRWEDLDTYISSLQYSVTLRHSQLREHEKSRPAPAPAALALPAFSAPRANGGDVAQQRVLEKSRAVPAPAPTLPAVCETPVAGGDVGQERILEKSRAVPAPAPTRPAVCETPATGGDSHMLRALEKSGSLEAPAITPAAGVGIVKGRKRKASSQEAKEVHAATRMQEGPADMRKIHEDATGKKKASTLQEDINDNGNKLRQAPPPREDNVLPAVENASTDTTSLVDPAASTAAVVQQELAGPAAAAARHASNDTTNSVNAAGVPKFTCLHLQRKRPPLTVPASTAVSAAPAVTGSDLENSKKRKVPSQEVEPANRKTQMQSVVEKMPQVEPEPHGLVVAKNTKASPCRPAAHVSGNDLPVTAVAAQVDAEPTRKVVGGIRHEPPATPPHASNVASQAVSPPTIPKVDNLSLAKVPEQQHSNEEVPQVKMEVSPLSLSCGNGLAQAGTRAFTMMQVDAARHRARRLARRDAQRPPNIVQASAPKNAGVPVAAGERGDSDATQDASDASPVPPGRSSGIAPSGTATQTAARQDFPAATRRGLNATNPVPRRGRREATGSLQARAPPNASNHVLQQQHMPKQGFREPISPAQKQEEWFSRNDGGGSRPVPEAQRRGVQGSDGRNKGNGRGKPMFCGNCGCKGHLAENCRTAKHLVELYLKAKQESQICYRCGCTGHRSRACRTPKHLVDLYQKDRAAKRAASNGSARDGSTMNTEVIC